MTFLAMALSLMVANLLALVIFAAIGARVTPARVSHAEKRATDCR